MHRLLAQVPQLDERRRGQIAELLLPGSVFAREPEAPTAEHEPAIDRALLHVPDLLEGREKPRHRPLVELGDGGDLGDADPLGRVRDYLEDAEPAHERPCSGLPTRHVAVDRHRLHFLP